MNALIGFVGFLPSIKTLELNKTLLLANKESLIVGGTLINDLLSSGHGKLYPIDSEHVAIAKCLFNGKGKDIEKILGFTHGDEAIHRDDLVVIDNNK